MERKSPHSRPWYAPLVHFAAHTLVGTGIFLIIGMPAVFLGWLVHKLRDYHVSEFTISVLVFLEHALIVVDAFLFVTYLGFTSWAALKEMRNE
ncbi:hypothetical protein AB2D15_31265 [Pseudomonas aeruginosa]|jgi:hypothetical protein